MAVAWIAVLPLAQFSGAVVAALQIGELFGMMTLLSSAYTRQRSVKRFITVGSEAAVWLAEP